MERNNNLLNLHSIKKYRLNMPKKRVCNISTLPLLTKFIPIKYEEPIIKDLAIILVYFNPTKSIRIVQNILLVKQYLESSKIPFYIAELAFNNEPFLFTPTTNIYQYRTSSYMFYKENLIYSILQHIPDTFTKICPMDADMMYDNPKWYNIVSETLNTYNVCQPFNVAYRLKIDYTINNALYSCIDDDLNFCPGFAWAFKRDWFMNNGFFEYAVVGGADGLYYRYITKYIQSSIYQSNIYINEYTNYMKTREKLPKVCSIKLNIYHLYHGSIDNRQYDTRHKLYEDKIQSFNLTNISELFIRRADNILEWNPRYKNEMNTFMLTYFTNRDDDSV